MKIKFNFFDLGWIFLLLMPVTSLIQEMPGAVYINKLILVCAVICFAIYYFKKMPDSLVIGILLLMICGFAMMIINNIKGYHSNSEKIIYLIMTFLIISMCTYEYDRIILCLKRNSKVVNLLIVIWDILVLISMTIPSCYKVVGSTWGNSKYFFSYTATGGMRLASIAFAIFIMSIVEWEINSKRMKYYLYMIIPLTTIILSGNRGCVLMLVAVCMYVVYRILNSNSKFIVCGILSAPVIGILLMCSKFGEKTISTLTKNADITASWFDKITNYRFRFIAIGIHTYLDYPFVNKIFGGGSESLEKLANSSSLDDISDMLVVFGIIGLAIYLAFIFAWIKKINYSIYPWYIKCIVYGCYVLAAFSHLFYHSINLVIGVGLCSVIIIIRRAKKETNVL